MVMGWFVSFDHDKLLVWSGDMISWMLLSNGVERRFLVDFGEEGISNVLVLA